MFDFYYTRFKPLYGVVCADNTVPNEVLLEIAAAFDHLSRRWQYSESTDEKACVDKVTAHLKRGSFDVYKLILKQTIDDYHKLCRIDTSAIDNGDFDKELMLLIRRIRNGAAYARTSEGNTEDDWHRAFDIWDKVYADCQLFYNKFQNHQQVRPTKRRKLVVAGRRWIEGFVVGIISGVAVNALWVWLFPPK